jgi:hypothetical protein
MRRCMILACLLALAPTLTHADEVFLKGGGRLSGRILTRTATSIEVEVGPGTITVPMSSVVRIEEQRSVLHEHHDRANALRADDVDGWLRLAKWSASQGLNTQARHAYTRVLALDPEQADANLALGRVQLDGRWVTEDESYRARGFLSFEGQWVTPAEKEVVLRQRDALRESELARAEAEWRAREAEARAREAEAVAAGSAVSIPLWWGAWGWGLPTWSSHIPGQYPSKSRSVRQPRPLGVWPSQSLGPWPSQQLGPWPSQTLGLWPSSPIGMWPSTQVGGPSSRPRATRPSGHPPPRPSGRTAPNAPQRSPRGGSR